MARIGNHDISNYIVRTGPSSVPASPTVVISANFVLYEMDINNPTGGAITVTVTDNQGSPQALFVATLDPGGNLSYEKRFGRTCPSGLQWSATNTGLVGHFSGRYY